MGYPGNSNSPNHDVVEPPRKTSSSFELLKAAAGLARSKPAETPAPSPPPAPSADIADAPAKAPAPVRPGVSVLSANVEVKGSLVSPSELHVYGAINGDVRAGDLTVFAGGSIKGEVTAENVQVHGAVEGNIHGKNVELGAGAVVRGDIFHSSLGIDVGSTFEGASKRSQGLQAEAKAASLKRNGGAPDAVRHSSPSQ